MRRLEYAGHGQIVDAVTKHLVSPHRIVFEYNLMSEAISKSSPKPFVMPCEADASWKKSEPRKKRRRF